MALNFFSADGTPKDCPKNFSIRGDAVPPTKIKIAFFEMGRAEQAYDIAALIVLAQRNMDVIVIANPGDFNHPDFIPYHSVVLAPTEDTKGFLVLFRESTIGGNSKCFNWATTLCVEIRLQLDSATTTIHCFILPSIPKDGLVSTIVSTLGYALRPILQRGTFVHFVSLCPTFEPYLTRILNELEFNQLVENETKFWSTMTETSDIVLHRAFSVFQEAVKARVLEDFHNTVPKFVMNFEPLTSGQISLLSAEDRAKILLQQAPLEADEETLFALHLTTTDKDGNRSDYRSGRPHPGGNEALLLEIGAGVNDTQEFICGGDCAEPTCQ